MATNEEIFLAQIQANLAQGFTTFGWKHGGLKAIPESIGEFTQLEQLDLSHNQFQSLPESIGNLTRLRTLELYQNQLQSLPESIGNLTELQYLGLRENKLQNLPESISNLTQLITLDLSANYLQSLPENIGNLARLQKLDLTVNELQSLPESIGNLTQLEVLMVDYNQLQALPENIGNLTRLWALHLSQNQLQCLPENIARLTKLLSFCLSNNRQLASLPYGLNVKTLDISGCVRLSQLPDDLTVTEWIKLADTALTYLPAASQGSRLFWDDVFIDERIAFYPETITSLEVLAETNAERRRVLLERMGYERFMLEAQPEVLDADHDVGGERSVLRIKLQDDEPLVCLSVIDPSTERHYLLRVPPTVTTCREAAAWIAGFDNPDDYRPLVET